LHLPLAIEVELEDPAVVRKAYAGVAKAMQNHGVPVEVRLYEPARGKPNPRFVVRAEGPIADWLRDAGFIDAAGRPAEPTRKLAPKRCDAAAYLRGVFMARGSVSEPRGAAHFELRLPTPNDARFAQTLLERLHVTAHTRQHKGATVLTVKDTAAIGSLLAAMGAHASYLQWEEGTVWKSVRGEANRLANCDTANARRTATAALEQKAIIEALDAAGELQRLPVALREAADLRLEHPQASLDELARLSRPPVSKAAMADRLRRLGRHAEALVG
jgi:DNA-binding protein WhiA